MPTYEQILIEQYVDADDLLKEIPIKDVVRYHGASLLEEFENDALLEVAGRENAKKHFGLVEPEEETA